MTARIEQSDMSPDPRSPPPLAVVGSQVSRDEQIFGQAFDGQVVRRFLQFVWPRRRSLLFAMVAVVLIISGSIYTRVRDVPVRGAGDA